MNDREKTVALLVDSENISPEYFADIFAKVKKRGNVTYCRIYGDFTKQQAAKWHEIAREYGAEPIQQFSFATGKNATDSRMIIDAMDILYTGRVDIFCLATSDSDFTNLAVRLRHDGVCVIGAGEEKTPPAFRSVCHDFIVLGKKGRTEKAAPKAVSKKVTDKTRKGDNPKKNAVSGQDKKRADDLAALLDTACAILAGGAWIQFSALIEELKKTYPKFDPRQFGAPKKDKVAFFKGQARNGQALFEMKKEGTIDSIRLAAKK